MSQNVKRVNVCESLVRPATIIGYFRLRLLVDIEIPETLKYWVGVQWGQSYLMGRMCHLNLGWPPF